MGHIDRRRGSANRILGLLGATSLSSLAMAPAVEAQETIELETVVVEAGILSGILPPVETGYEPDAIGGVAAKVDLPPRQVPFSVTQVTAELMEDRGDQTVYDVIEDIPGAHTQGTNSDTGSNVARAFSSRGFDLGDGGTVLYNGHRIYGVGSNYRSTASLAAVELLKGPAAIYYGAAEPGGVINYVFKKPLAAPRYEIGVHGDSFGSYGTTLDAGGPVPGTGDMWRYRFVGEFDHTDDWRDVVEEEPKTVYGSVEFEPNEVFQTRLSYEYLDIDGVPQRYDTIRLADESLFPVPEDFFAGHSTNYVDIKQHTVLWETEWTFSDAFNAETYVLYQKNDQDHETTRIGGRGGGAPDATGALPRTVHVGYAEDESLAAGIDLKGKFDTGAFEHQWLAGYAYSHQDSWSGVDQVSTGTAGSPYRPTPVLPFAADNGPYPYGSDLFATIPTDGRGGASARTDHNVYAQDVLTLPNGATKLMAGLGYAYSEQEDGPSIGGTTVETLEQGFLTPRLAVMHDLSPEVTIYGSYAESYMPQLIVNDYQTYEVLDDPEIGRQYEAGYKQDIFGGRGLFSAAVFLIQKENIARRLFPDDALNTNQVLDGVYESHGFEVSFSGQVTDWWTTSSGYALLDTDVVESDDPVLRGGPIPYIARHNLGLWNKFRLHGSPDARYGQFDLGVGVNAYSRARDTNDFWRKSYALVDLGLYYRKEIGEGRLLKAALRVHNLFDKDYFDPRHFGSSVTFGDPRRVSFSVSTVF